MDWLDELEDRARERLHRDVYELLHATVLCGAATVAELHGDLVGLRGW